MKYVTGMILLLSFLLVSLADGTMQEAAPQTANNLQGGDTELLDRIDFGNAFIMGQTIKSGAVYLLKRKKSEIKSMLKDRESFREEIMEDFPMETSKGNKVEE